jgi:hypothetical protein
MVSYAEGGSGWKLVSVLPCLSNIVTALANGECLGKWSYAEGGSGRKLVSILQSLSNVVTALANGYYLDRAMAESGVSNRSQAYLPGATSVSSWQVRLAPGKVIASKD